MADKQLRSISFPGLEDRYIIPEPDTTLTESGRPADAKKVGDKLSDLKEDLSDLGLSVVDGKLCVTYVA